MIYFYWLTGLGFALALSILISVSVDNREEADRTSI